MDDEATVGPADGPTDAPAVAGALCAPMLASSVPGAAAGAGGGVCLSSAAWSPAHFRYSCICTRVVQRLIALMADDEEADADGEAQEDRATRGTWARR